MTCTSAGAAARGSLPHPVPRRADRERSATAAPSATRRALARLEPEPEHVALAVEVDGDRDVTGPDTLSTWHSCGSRARGDPNRSETVCARTEPDLAANQQSPAETGFPPRTLANVQAPSRE